MQLRPYRINVGRLKTFIPFADLDLADVGWAGLPFLGFYLIRNEPSGVRPFPAGGD